MHPRALDPRPPGRSGILELLSLADPRQLIPGQHHERSRRTQRGPKADGRWTLDHLTDRCGLNPERKGARCFGG